MTDILSSLNEAQRAAVENFQTASLIIAGAGSGKTRVLTSRIAYMLQQGVEPQSILALTFTNKAAREMRERIAQVAGPEAGRVVMGTFHSIFLRILRAEADKIGFDPNFTIYDTSDSVSLLKNIIKEMQLSDDVYKPKSVFSRISNLKNELVTPYKYAEDTTAIADDRKRQQPMFAEVYKRYAERCKANNAMDFDDMLLYMNLLLHKCSDVLEKYQRIFQYILVDEYQDTNYAQYRIVKLLGKTHGRVCVVGDDSQSIYSFRGARIENIHGFKRDFPAAQIYKLEQNYRSTQTIVNAANSVIAHNPQQKELQKECFSTADMGEKIRVIRGYTDDDEAKLIALDIREKMRQGANYDDFAVLYRANSRSRKIEEHLVKNGIPYLVYRGHAFFNRKEVKDFIAYFRLIVNPQDDEALKRIINVPSRKIGETSVSKIEEFAKRKNISLWELIDTLDYERTQDKSLAKKIIGFRDLIRRMISKQSEMDDVLEFGRYVLMESGLNAMYSDDKDEECKSAKANLEEVLNSMKQMSDEHLKNSIEQGLENYKSLTIEDWLQSVALISDVDQKEQKDTPKVTLMTIHSSKGLEFNRVYIIGVEQEQFPGSSFLTEEKEIEEERRLFYVAVTRAKKAAVLTYCTSRYAMGKMMDCTPSQFIDEIDSQYVEGYDKKRRTGMQNPSLGYGGQSNGYGGQSGARQIYGGYGQPARQQMGGSARPQMGQPAQPRPQYPSYQQPRPQPQPRPTVVDERFRKVGVRRAVEVESEAAMPATSSAVQGAYRVGQKVEHAKFGMGRVAAVEAASGDLKITVDFSNPMVGQKSLLAKFAKLKIVE